MLRDRGNKKWTSLMLPEHVELLKKMWQEEKKVSRPIIDVQMAEIIEMELIQAHYQNESITLFCYKYGYIKQMVGKVTALNPHVNTISLTSDFDQTHKVILFHDILAIL